MAASPVIEVFADIWCPFTHVGLRAVDQARRAGGHMEVALVVRAWPLELVNSAPMSAETTAHHAHDLREQVAPDLFTHLDTTHFPTTTLPALALTAAAYRRSPATGEAMAFALRDAMFEQGLDISARGVLEELRVRLGVPEVTDADRTAVLDDWEDGKRRGVLGSPHFFCGTDDLFCPSLQITRDDTGLDIQRNTRRLTDFLDHCLEA